MELILTSSQASLLFEILDSILDDFKYDPGLDAFSRYKQGDPLTFTEKDFLDVIAIRNILI